MELEPSYFLPEKREEVSKNMGGIYPLKLGPSRGLMAANVSVDPSYTTLLTALVAQYKLTNNFVDDSSNAYTLTKGSTATFGTDAGDSYYSPDSTGANTDSGGPSTFAAIASPADFSIACTINFSDSTDMQVFTNGTTLSAFNFYVSCDQSNHCFLFLRKTVAPGTPITWSGGNGLAGTYTPGTKTQFIYSYTATSPAKTCKTYKDGVLVATSSHATTWVPSNSATGIIGPANLGLFGSTSDKIYDILVFNRALTQLEATYLASNHAPF